MPMIPGSTIVAVPDALDEFGNPVPSPVNNDIYKDPSGKPYYLNSSGTPTYIPQGAFNQIMDPIGSSQGAPAGGLGPTEGGGFLGITSENFNPQTGNIDSTLNEGQLAALLAVGGLAGGGAAAGLVGGGDAAITPYAGDIAAETGGGAGATGAGVGATDATLGAGGTAGGVSTGTVAGGSGTGLGTYGQLAKLAGIGASGLGAAATAQGNNQVTQAELDLRAAGLNQTGLADYYNQIAQMANLGLTANAQNITGGSAYQNQIDQQALLGLDTNAQNITGQQAAVNENLGLASEEDKQRATDLQNVMRASFLENQKASPYDTKGLTALSPDALAALNSVSSQGKTDLSTPQVHQASATPTQTYTPYSVGALPAPTPYTPYSVGALPTPTQPVPIVAGKATGPLQNVANIVDPALGTLGALASMYGNSQGGSTDTSGYTLNGAM